MKFIKSALAAIVVWMVFVSSASASVGAVVNICEVKPDGSVHTVRLTNIVNDVLYYKYYFKNVANQHTSIFTDLAISLGPKTFALKPGTYTLSYSPPVGNHSHLIWPHIIVLRPYTLSPGQGTGCVLNVPVTGPGTKDERVPTTTLSQ